MQCIDTRQTRERTFVVSLPFLFKVKKFGAKLEWENWSQFRTGRSFVVGGCKERVSHHRRRRRQSHFVGVSYTISIGFLRALSPLLRFRDCVCIVPPPSFRYSEDRFVRTYTLIEGRFFTSN